MSAGSAVSTDRIPVLSARLARLAVEVDELAQELLAERVGYRDELLLAVPIAHLAMALGWLQQALYECERFDLTQSWSHWLVRGRREESDDGHTEGHRDSRPGVPGQRRAAAGGVLVALTVWARRPPARWRPDAAAKLPVGNAPQEVPMSTASSRSSRRSRRRRVKQRLKMDNVEYRVDR
jgi:hypothetical protein